MKKITIYITLILAIGLSIACGGSSKDNSAEIAALTAKLATLEAKPTLQPEIQVVTATPTDGPPPTNTPTGPTDTPTPLPPTATPTADPRLFWDDFENGLKPEWGMSGDPVAAVNGQLVMDKGSFRSAIIGDSSWQNYNIQLDNLRPQGNCDNCSIDVQVRVQDNSNYMRFNCYTSRSYQHCGWHKVVNGEEIEIPGTNTWMWELWHDGDTAEIEVEGNNYRLIVASNPVIRFSDDTFTNGGFTLKGQNLFRLDGIEVRALP